MPRAPHCRARAIIARLPRCRRRVLLTLLLGSSGWRATLIGDPVWRTQWWMAHGRLMRHQLDPRHCVQGRLWYHLPRSPWCVFPLECCQGAFLGQQGEVCHVPRSRVSFGAARRHVHEWVLHQAQVSCRLAARQRPPRLRAKPGAQSASSWPQSSLPLWQAGDCHSASPIGDTLCWKWLTLQKSPCQGRSRSPCRCNGWRYSDPETLHRHLNGHPH